MKNFAQRYQFHFLGCTNLTNPTSNSPVLIPIKAKSHIKDHRTTYPYPSIQLSKSSSIPIKTLAHPTTTKKPAMLKFTPVNQESSKNEFPQAVENSKFVVFGAVTIGILWFLMAVDDDQKALALGPEGPLVEEFWDNMRRYALYALTVSTGALYTIFQPIVELLKNPISAVLIILIFGGSIYFLSQVLSVMLGISDFNYDYAY